MTFFDWMRRFQVNQLLEAKHVEIKEFQRLYDIYIYSNYKSSGPSKLKFHMQV